MEKVKEDEFLRVCRLAKLVERKAKIPTVTTLGQMEGLELSAGKIISFWIKNPGKPDQEKLYGLPVDDKQIIAVIGAFETKAPEPKKEEKKNEQPKSEGKEVQKEIHEVTLLPAFLTPALMSNWAKLSTMERVLMFQKTPKDQIYEVNVGKNPETGKAEMASYVTGNYMFKEANAAFLFDWFLSDLQITVCPTGIGVTAKLNGYFSEYGKYLTRPAIGYQELNKKVDTELAKKGATTDAIKKGLSLFGFNSDVYSGEA